MVETIEERTLRTKIRQFVQENYRTFIQKKVMRVCEGFETVEEFCKATPGEWLAAYRKARPQSNVDLGARCLQAIEDAIAFVKEDAISAQKAMEARKAAERELAETKARQEAERKAKGERENPKFSYEELKSLIAFMELCNIKAIDLKAVKNWIAMIDVRIKETND